MKMVRDKYVCKDIYRTVTCENTVASSINEKATLCTVLYFTDRDRAWQSVKTNEAVDGDILKC